MSPAPLLPLLEGPANRPSALSFENVKTLEIVTPDGYSAALLQDYVSPWFSANIVGNPGWIVRFHPPPVGGDWVVELLALVERWLKSVPHIHVNVHP